MTLTPHSAAATVISGSSACVLDSLRVRCVLWVGVLWGSLGFLFFNQYCSFEQFMLILRSVIIFYFRCFIILWCKCTNILLYSVSNQHGGCWELQCLSTHVKEIFTIFSMLTMFSNPSSNSDPCNYDFEKEENAVKWKGVFVNSLRKVMVCNWNFLGLLFWPKFYYCVNQLSLPINWGPN